MTVGAAQLLYFSWCVKTVDYYHLLHTAWLHLQNEQTLAKETSQVVNRAQVVSNHTFLFILIVRKSFERSFW